MTVFALHPQLNADATFVADWPLCRVLLMEDARYPWLILVPRRAGAAEIIDLVPGDRSLLMDELMRASAIVRSLPGVIKLNIGALGNVVPQLHVHVLGRRIGDPAGRAPVWGHSPPVAYAATAREALIELVRSH